MKKLLFILFLLPLAAFAQDGYKASNGKTYHVGDTIKLGRGSAPNGYFRYLNEGGWGMMMTYNSNRSESQFNAARSFSGMNVNIKKIKTIKGHAGSVRTYFVVGAGTITNYWLFIEDAIATCEVADCVQPTQQVSAAAVPDKFDQLKKLKDLFDSGALTKDEYDAQKKKILDQ